MSGLAGVGAQLQNKRNTGCSDIADVAALLERYLRPFATC